MTIAEGLAPATVPAGVRVYAVGDVHGCDGQLAALHRQISLHWSRRPAARCVIVHLGDYLDRGPDSAAVIARLRGAPPVGGAAAVCLLGNHEQMMLEALDPTPDPSAMALWQANGGAATLASYGDVPGGDLIWLRALPDRFALGGYLFVHAGIRPGVALHRQHRMDLLWMREPFLSWRGALPAVVVHGHTPAAAAEVLPHRIGLDTGAVYGGPLTCGVLEADRVGFLQA
jgi:serine/threonine protein phosphatase 1